MVLETQLPIPSVQRNQVYELKETILSKLLFWTPFIHGCITVIWIILLPTCLPIIIILCIRSPCTWIKLQCYSWTRTTDWPTSVNMVHVSHRISSIPICSFMYSTGELWERVSPTWAVPCFCHRAQETLPYRQNRYIQLLPRMPVGHF